MSDPYGPTFPPPSFMAPVEPGEKSGALTRLRGGVLLVAPVAALVLVVGMLAVVIYRGEHPQTVDSDPARQAKVPTSVQVVPAQSS